MSRTLAPLFCLAILASLSGCQNICADAAAHYATCTGQQVSPAATCNKAAAEQMLAQPCWVLEGGKGDTTGQSCPSDVLSDCPQTVVLSEQRTKRLDGELSHLVLYVGKHQAGTQMGRFPVAVVADPAETTLQPEEALSEEMLQSRLVVQAGGGAMEALTWSELGVKGEQWFDHDGKRYFVRVDSIQSQVVGPTTTNTAAVTVGLAAELEDLEQPGDGERLLVHGRVRPEDKISFTYGIHRYVVEISHSDGVSLSGRVKRCLSETCLNGFDNQPDSDRLLPFQFNLTAAKRRLQLECRLNQALGPVSFWFELVSPPTTMDAATGCAGQPCPPAVVLRGFGGKAVAPTPSKPEGALTTTIDRAAVAAETGMVTFSGQVTNGSAASSLPTSLTLTLRDAEDAEQTLTSLPIPLIDSGASHAWTYAHPTALAPGNYVVVAALVTQAGANDTEQSLVVPGADTGSGQADLLVVGVTKPEVDQATGNVTVAGKVCNQGTAAATASKLEISFKGDNAVPARKLDVPALEPGEASCHPFSEVFEGLEAGSYRLVVEADAEAQVDEKDEANEAGNIEFDVPERSAPSTAKPDLALVKVEGQAVGSQVVFTVEICNRGSAPATAFAAGLFVRPTAAGEPPSCGDEPQARWTLAEGLAPGACETHKSVPFNAIAAREVWAVADLECLLDEADEQNNLKQTTAEAAAAPVEQPQASAPRSNIDPNDYWANSGAAPNQKQRQPVGGCQIGAAGTSGGFTGLLLALGLLCLARRRF